MQLVLYKTSNCIITIFHKEKQRNYSVKIIITTI